MRNPACTLVLVAAGIAAAVEPARAQCTTINFDDLPVGTVITNQYPGVTFSGRDTDGTSGVNPIIYNPNGSTSSEPQCLSAFGDGFNEFSPEFLRLDFAQDQTEVTFVLGVRTGCSETDTVAVRYYEYSGGSYILRGTFNPYVNGTLPNERVLVFVRVTRPNNATFRRIEIEAGAGGICAERYELIDDLSFDIDTTAPVASIDAPAGCLCNPTSVTGSAYDPDGSITNWQLHRRQLETPGATWVLIRQTSTEIIDGELGPWNTSGPDGRYTLRLRVTNSCGTLTEAFMDVYMDKAFNSLTLRCPTAGAILGGTVCFDGTVWDHCGGDFTVEKRAVGGAFAPVDSINPPWIITDPLGSWNTRAATPDGNYEVRVTGTDDCGNSAASPIVPVVIDNTAPVAAITSPANCAAVSGVVPIVGLVNDAHLQSWTLYYTGGAAHGWVPVPGGSGGANINGVLANWDTSGLEPCCYTLRLVATDQSSLDCGPWTNQTEFLVSVDVGEAPSCPGDLNGDGFIDLDDLSIMLIAFGSACP